MKRNDASPGEGLLNIHKPPGLTSHDVVAVVRRLTRVGRVGHAGTLDPQATGVLLAALGQGTKLVQFLHELPKTYRATLQLGIRTDTQDGTGSVVAVRAVGPLAPEDVELVLRGFQGWIEQIPPMYSALKQQGQRLYTLARQGKEVERQPRRVQIFRILLQSLRAGTLTLEVECSSGTYIRVLADDIGEKLGCGAHLRELVRTAVGPFRCADALTLDALQEAVHQGAWQRYLIPLAEAVAAFPAIVVTHDAARALGRGIAPTAENVASMQGSFEAGDTIAVRTSDGTLLAMGAAACRAADVRLASSTSAIVRLRRVVRA
ncbi:MAG: tRNA pseudouridine(55) synthase TruB [Candidatus Entotheonellia bacterium]